MIKLFRIPVSRLTLAIVLSTLIHVAFICLPFLQLQQPKLQLPQLTIRLMPLPKTVAPPAPIPESVSQDIRPDDNSSDKPIVNTADTMKEMQRSAEIHLFPKHLYLTFDVYKGSGILRAGEIRHQLDIRKDTYTLRAFKQTSGISSLDNGVQLTQISQGKFSEQGLRPDSFKEEKITNVQKQSSTAIFDWATQKLRFSKGVNIAVPADAQDMLSFMYQLSQISMRREIIHLSLSDSVQLENYRIEIGRAEDIITPMGSMRALHLSKMHAENEPYFEIWLGLEYRLLPVKFRQVNGSGEVTEEYVITDIRAGDDESK